MTYAYSGVNRSDRDPEESARGPGRPRKWATEAERARAYRQRRAAELAEPGALREERNALRRALRQVEGRLAKSEASWNRAERQRAVAADSAEELEKRLAFAQCKIDQLGQDLAAERELRAAAEQRANDADQRRGRPRTTQPAPDMNRAQRRAAAKRRR